MIKIENIQVEGLEPAIRGMRNPKNSWGRSDSMEIDFGEGVSSFVVGDNDLKLMNSLFKAGSEHRKYDRMIVVWLDITAPLYWWKEFDTYKVGTVADSCSTMHKIHAKEFTMDDFSHEHLDEGGKLCLGCTVENLNWYRNRFLQDRNKDDWWNMIQLLPSSYNQKRTVMMNYEVCARIIQQRSNHKLDEWHVLTDKLKTLPYLKMIMEGCDPE